MPVVITDFTNKTWAVEDPMDGMLHVGWTGKSGPRLEDLLEFLDKKRNQFDNFVSKKRTERNGPVPKQTRKRSG